MSKFNWLSEDFLFQIKKIPDISLCLRTTNSRFSRFSSIHPFFSSIHLYRVSPSQCNLHCIFMSSVFQFSHVILIFMQRSSSRWAHNPRFYTAVIVAGIDDSRKENKGNIKKNLRKKKKKFLLSEKIRASLLYILSKLFFQNFHKSRFGSETRRADVLIFHKAIEIFQARKNSRSRNP